MTVKIVGAGMAGLLAANMLRHNDPVIIEKQPRLPNNHSAVLRFRTHKVADAIGIRFKRVSMIKATQQWRNPVADALAYSFKNGRVRLSDRSVIAGLVQDERFIAPADLIAKMAKGLTIQYMTDFGKTSDGWNGDPVISTLPMPTLMDILQYPERGNIAFRSVAGINIRCSIAATNAYISLLVPDPDIAWSRVSITGSEMIIEVPYVNENFPLENFTGMAGQFISQACDLLGIPVADTHSVEIVHQRYAKIMPIAEEVRRAFMFWATDTYNIYSLGRFATWRPGLLLDDLVHDIEKIREWIESADRYAVQKAR